VSHVQGSACGDGESACGDVQDRAVAVLAVVAVGGGALSNRELAGGADGDVGEIELADASSSVRRDRRRAAGNVHRVGLGSGEGQGIGPAATGVAHAVDGAGVDLELVGAQAHDLAGAIKLGGV